MSGRFARVLAVSGVIAIGMVLLGCGSDSSDSTAAADPDSAQATTERPARGFQARLSKEEMAKLIRRSKSQAELDRLVKEALANQTAAYEAYESCEKTSRHGEEPYQFDPTTLKCEYVNCNGGADPYYWDSDLRRCVYDRERDEAMGGLG